jgi:hypothetical protein
VEHANTKCRGNLTLKKVVHAITTELERAVFFCDRNGDVE